MAHLEQAIQLDPSFALAYRGLAASYTNLYGPARGAMYYAKAYELRDHASERERLLITADYYANVLGDLNRATAAYEQLIASYPRYARAHNSLGIYYAEMGRYEQATEMVRAALDLPPTTNLFFGNLANNLIAQQRFDESREAIAQAHARKADDFILHLDLYAMGFFKGNTAAMSEQLQWLTDRPDTANFGFSIASDTAAYSGRLQQARELTTRAADAAVRADSKEYAGINMELAAVREAAYGNAQQARQGAATGLKFDPESQAVRVMAGVALAMREMRRRRPLSQKS